VGKRAHTRGEGKEAGAAEGVEGTEEEEEEEEGAEEAGGCWAAGRATSTSSPTRRGRSRCAYPDTNHGQQVPRPRPCLLCPHARIHS
jgi:hypothetical protein